jgi:hypothetical protein
VSRIHLGGDRAIHLYGTLAPILATAGFRLHEEYHVAFELFIHASATYFGLRDAERAAMQPLAKAFKRDAAAWRELAVASAADFGLTFRQRSRDAIAATIEDAWLSALFQRRSQTIAATSTAIDADSTRVVVRHCSDLIH